MKIKNLDGLVVKMLDIYIVDTKLCWILFFKVQWRLYSCKDREFESRSGQWFLGFRFGWNKLWLCNHVSGDFRRFEKFAFSIY